MKLEQQLKELEEAIEALDLSDEIKKALLLIKKEVHEAYADVAKEFVEDCLKQSELAHKRYRGGGRFEDHWYIDAQWYKKMANHVTLMFLDQPPTKPEFVLCTTCGKEITYGQRCRFCAK